MSFNNLSRFQLPYTPALVADAGPDIPGGLGANKGYWRKQWRGNDGQWIKMGNIVDFHVRLDNGKVVKASGTFDGSDGTRARVKVTGNKYVSDGYYYVNSDNGGSKTIAMIDDAYIKGKGLDVGEAAPDSKEAKNAQTLADLTPEPPDSPKPAVLESVYDGMPEDFTDQYALTSPSVDDLTEEQYEALQWFTDSGYEASLKKAKGESISSAQEEMLDEITKLIDATETSSDQVLWRGLTITDPEYADAVDNYKPGMVVTSKTFNSHSEDADRALFYANMDVGSKNFPLLKRVVFRTHAPRGTNAYRIPDEASSYSSEKEVIFHQDSRYEIVNVSETADGLRVVDMRTLPRQEEPNTEDYKMSHSAPYRDEDDFNKSLDKIDEIFPPNVLDPAKQKQLYGSGYPEADKEAFEVINAIKGNPDAEVTVYRGVPDGVDSINAGDWVTLSKKYAQEHINSNVPGGKIIALKVKASDIFTNADSIQEWGYDPAAPAEPEKPKPAVPTPAMMAKKKPVVTGIKKLPDSPSETRSKAAPKEVKAFDGNNQIVSKGDPVFLQLERDGKSFKAEGEFLGISEGSLKGKDESYRPIIRFKGQDGIADGDYPIRADVLNLGPGDDKFRDTRTPLASTLEAEHRIPDATRLTQLTPQQFDAVFAYTTENAFDDVRILMEKNPGKTLSEIEATATSSQDKETIEQIKLIEDAIYNSPLEQDTLLYRGVEVLDDADFERVIASLKVGQPIYDSSLVSTSLDVKVAEKFTGGQGILFEINAPAGSPAFETAPFHNDLSLVEDELMLPRNSEFVITEIGSPENGIIRVKVDYTPPLTRQNRVTPTAQITTPKFKAVASVDNIRTDSEGTKYLDTLGTLPSDGQLDTIRSQTKQLLTTDPDYVPFDPDMGMNAEREEQLKTLTPLGEAVYTYIDSSSLLNKSLRNKDAAREASDRVKQIDEAMLISAHLPPGATVYRMMKLSRFNSLGLEPGEVIFDRGFMSTTTSEVYVQQQTDRGEIPMRIVMPGNTSGLDLSSISWFKNEDEYLLPRKTGLRYLGIDSNGMYVFERVT